MKTPIVTKNKAETTQAVPLDHYSASAMIRFSSNPIMFKIEYINRDIIESTSSISSIIGKAFHRAMDVYYGGSDDHIVGNEQEAIQYGLEVGTTFLEQYNEGFISYSTMVPNKQKAIEKFVFAFNSYVQENKYKPEEIVSTEEKLIEKINVMWRGKELSLPVPLKGYTDKIVLRNEKLSIVDYKCVSAFSDPERIDGSKIIAAVIYYLLVYANRGIEPYSMIFEEVKNTKNRDGGPQVRRYELVFKDNDLYFDFFFRFYDDMTRALLGEAVFVPNVHTLFDNEVAVIAYIQRLDETMEVAKLMKKHKVQSITEVLKKEIHAAKSMRALMKNVEKQFISAKNLNYANMTNEEKIATKLLEHGMMLQFDSKVEGATVDLYRYVPSIGLKMSRIESFEADVEQVLGVSGIRVLAPIPNSTMVGFEVPRSQRSFPELSDNSGSFDLAIGQDVMGNPHRFDIREAPHLLVAGASGSGKSVFLSSVIEQLLAVPNVSLTLMDPKRVELSMYADSADYHADLESMLFALKKLHEKMEDRYKKLASMKKRNIEGTDMNYEIVVIDEYGDIVMQDSPISKQISTYVLLLAQKGRAAGIHMIISTQRPSTDVITGTIKANFPTKVCLRTAKSTDSLVIMDSTGAEKLVGKGDLLFQSDAGTIRLQGYITK